MFTFLFLTHFWNVKESEVKVKRRKRKVWPDPVFFIYCTRFLSFIFIFVLSFENENERQASATINKKRPSGGVAVSFTTLRSRDYKTLDSQGTPANQGVNLLCREGNSQPGHWMKETVNKRCKMNRFFHLQCPGPLPRILLLSSAIFI